MVDTGVSGERHESGERLAPVTYLHGAEPDTGSGTQRDSLRGSEPDTQPESPPLKRPAGSFDRISNVSMYALARRGMSTDAMRDYLIGREFEADDVEDEIDRLTGVGLLDDTDLARTLIDQLHDRKGLGRAALTAELRRRGLDPLTIEEAMSTLDSDDEQARANELAERRAPQLRNLDSETARRRLNAFLMRKGYPGDIVRRAVAHALPQADGGNHPSFGTSGSGASGSGASRSGASKFGQSRFGAPRSSRSGDGPVFR